MMCHCKVKKSEKRCLYFSCSCKRRENDGKKRVMNSIRRISIQVNVNKSHFSVGNYLSFDLNKCIKRIMRAAITSLDALTGER